MTAPEREAWKEVVLDRLSRWVRREGMTQRKLAEKLGITEAAVSQWMSDKTEPDWWTLARICRELKLPADYLLALTEAPQPEDVAVAGSDFVALPCLADKLAAGVPLLTFDRFSSERYAFRAGWFDRIGVPHNKLYLAHLAGGHFGESMLDTIQPGALIAIDTRPINKWAAAMNKRIFVVRDPGAEGVTVKRVSLRGDQLVCTPDNPESHHLPFAIDLKGRPLQEILVGRVVWWANGAS